VRLLWHAVRVRNISVSAVSALLTAGLAVHVAQPVYPQLIKVTDYKLDLPYTCMLMSLEVNRLQRHAHPVHQRHHKAILSLN